MPIPWTDDLNLGISIIDEQHKNFVAILNRLYKAIDELKTKVEIGDIFDDLVAYTDVHFGTEEKYFKEFSYEGAEEHIAEHEKFRAKIAGFMAQEEASSVPTELVDYLENWLIDHVETMDKKYVPCFKEHGLK